MSFIMIRTAALTSAMWRHRRYMEDIFQQGGGTQCSEELRRRWRIRDVRDVLTVQKGKM